MFCYEDIRLFNSRACRETHLMWEFLRSWKQNWFFALLTSFFFSYLFFSLPPSPLMSKPNIVECWILLINNSYLRFHRLFGVMEVKMKMADFNCLKLDTKVFSLFFILIQFKRVLEKERHLRLFKFFDLKNSINSLFVEFFVFYFFSASKNDLS